MSFKDQIQNIGEIAGAETLEPGRMSWLHGVKQAKTPGAFYIKETAVADPPAAPWALDERFSDAKPPELGYSATTLRVMVIGERSQWFIPGAQRGDMPVWLPRYEDGAKKLQEWLMLVEGIDDVMVFSASGMHKARPFHNAISHYRKGLLTQASRIAKQQMPLWSFWLPFANQQTKDGKTEYIEATSGSGETFGSVVTPPALYLPADALDTLFVGPELLERGAELKQQYAEWFKVRRGDHVEAEYSISDAPQLPPAQPAPQLAAKNVPQVVADIDDIPF